jgi:DNA-binding winged helix-turn-helix (wHTH) protein
MIVSCLAGGTRSGQAITALFRKVKRRTQIIEVLTMALVGAVIVFLPVMWSWGPNRGSRYRRVSTAKLRGETARNRYSGFNGGCTIWPQSLVPVPRGKEYYLSGWANVLKPSAHLSQRFSKRCYFQPEQQLVYVRASSMWTPQNRLLRKGEKPIGLTPKAFECCSCLVQHSGEVVSKDELIQAVWPDSFVEDSNLTQTVFMLRKALGETSSQRYILTVQGRGLSVCTGSEDNPCE